MNIINKEFDKQANSNQRPGNPDWGKKSEGTGKSGNPNGRPPGLLCITSRQKEMLLEVCPFDTHGRTWLEVLSESGLRQALSKPEAMSNLQDRVEGKVIDRHQIEEIPVSLVYQQVKEDTMKPEVNIKEE